MRFSAPVQTGLGAHPASCTMGTGSFPGKYGRGVLLTTHPLLVPWSWKSRATPLPTLWATTGPVTGTLYLCTPQLRQLHPAHFTSFSSHMTPLFFRKIANVSELHIASFCRAENLDISFSVHENLKKVYLAFFKEYRRVYLTTLRVIKII